MLLGVHLLIWVSLEASAKPTGREPAINCKKLHVVPDEATRTPDGFKQ